MSHWDKIWHDHISRALGQSQNKWLNDSTSAWHSSQQLSFKTFLFTRLSFMGKMFLQALQGKWQTLWVTFTCHKYFQNFLEFLSSDTTLESDPKLISRAILYALLTLKLLFAVGAQTCLSSGSLELEAIPCITSTSWGRKSLWTRSFFHAPTSASISTSIVALSGQSEGGETTLWVDGVGSHLSLQIWIPHPLPTCHLIPFFTTSWVAKILLQA